MNTAEAKKFMEVVKQLKELLIYLAAMKKDVKNLQKRVSMLEASR
jgi:hypothetical protein